MRHRRGPGTTLVAVGGAIWSPCGSEIEDGTPFGSVLGEAGRPGLPARGVLVGGLTGAWSALVAVGQVPSRAEDLRGTGSTGGGVAAPPTVQPRRACPNLTLRLQHASPR